MRDVTSFTQILLYKCPVDGRKQINGLAQIAADEMDLSPQEANVFVFINKRKDCLRMLYWDRTGFALWIKRLEKAKFRWPHKMEGDVISLNAKEIQWLLDGIDLVRYKPHSSLSFSSL